MPTDGIPAPGSCAPTVTFGPVWPPLWPLGPLWPPCEPALPPWLPLWLPLWLPPPALCAPPELLPPLDCGMFEPLW